MTVQIMNGWTGTVESFEVPEDIQEANNNFDDLYSCCRATCYEKQAKHHYKNIERLLQHACMMQNRGLVKFVVAIALKWRDEDTPSGSMQDRAMKHCMNMLLVNHHNMINHCLFDVVMEDMGDIYGE